MGQRSILTWIMVTVVALGWLVPLGTGAHAQTDPAGEFTIPVPTNWEAETVDDVDVLTSPDRGITVYALTVEGSDVTAAIDEAWRQVEPEFAAEPEDTTEVPAPPGIEQFVVVTYDSGVESGMVIQGLGQLIDGVVYVPLADAEVTAATRRAARIQILVTGFTPTGVDAADLTGVAPRELTDELLAEFGTYVAASIEQFGIPGAAVAIVQDGAVVYEQGFGVRELGSDEPVTPETLMIIGSVTKSLTTMRWRRWSITDCCVETRRWSISCPASRSPTRS